MSLIKAIKAQLGLSNTPANNFTITAEADNGTLKLARGNAGATTQDILTVRAAGNVSHALMPLVGSDPIISNVYGGVDSLTKYADGTFIFTTQVSVANPTINTYSSVDKTIGFTAVGAFIVTATCASSNAAPTGGFVFANQLNQTTFRITACSNVVCTSIYNIIVVGRWK